MVRHILFMSITIAAILPVAACAKSDRLKSRGEAWQKILESSSFHFSESDAGVLYALSQFGGKCRIHMIYDPVKRWQITFKFVKDGKDLLVIEGHAGSVFLTENNILYFAHFPQWTSGCVVTAHDLGTGKELWKTTLSAVGTPAHSAYSNRVTMGLSSLTVDGKDEGVVSITGRESYGDYVEILDRATGTVLAHKVYRQGFGK